VNRVVFIANILFFIWGSLSGALLICKNWAISKNSMVISSILNKFSFGELLSSSSYSSPIYNGDMW